MRKSLSASDYTDQPNLRSSDQIWRRRIGIKTSAINLRMYWITLECEFWLCLDLIAKREQKTLQDIFFDIYNLKDKRTTFSDAAKIFVANYTVSNLGKINDIALSIESLCNTIRDRSANNFESTFVMVKE